MANLTAITADMIQDATEQLQDVTQKHSAWLGDHIDDMVEIIKNTPDGGAARRDFVAFCKQSPFDNDLKVVGRLADVLGVDLEGE